MHTRKESLKIFKLAGSRTLALTSAIPVKRFQQLRWQPNWELVIKLVRNRILYLNRGMNT